jgi:hypothetical protein
MIYTCFCIEISKHNAFYLIPVLWTAIPLDWLMRVYVDRDSWHRLACPKKGTPRRNKVEQMSV